MADDLDARIAQLTGNVPAALLPVRIEARFFDHASELRVRIFPDQIHIDAHEPELTVAERDGAMTYWIARFATPDPGARGHAAWQALAGRFGAARAAWLVRALQPLNLVQLGQPVPPRFPTVTLRPENWSRAARAAALPECWVVIGQRGGRELFRKRSADVAATLEVTPTTDADDVTPVTDDAVALQPAARWLTDFDVAERAGMALRIGAADLPAGQSLAGGLDALYVLGIDARQTASQGAAALQALLAAHAYSDGVAGLAPDTPTNLTGTAPSRGADDGALSSALDPDHHPPAETLADSGIDRLWRAFGLVLTGNAVLGAIPGSELREQQVAGKLADALWESTLGAYLTDFLNPNFDDDASFAVRRHVREHLFPGGPFPALRIGKQPYGVLPVVAPQRFTGADARFERELAGVLTRLRALWRAAVPRAPHLGRSSDLDADLTELLQTTPLSATLRFRYVLGPLAVNATSGLEQHAAAQERITEMLGAHLAWPHRPDIAGFSAHPQNHPLRVPLVGAKPDGPGAPLSVNYLQQIADLARTSGSFEAIKAREDADTLLESLAAYAVARELHRADVATIEDFRQRAGQISARAPQGVLTAAEFIGIEAVERPPAASGVLVTTPAEAARVVIPSLTGQQTVRQFVTAAVTRGSTPTATVRTLGDTLDAMEWLGTRSVDELERALRGLLDGYAYRLDAWITSLATRRLAQSRAAAPAGVHLGAYGWLEDLRPDVAPTSIGFIHAPSLPQAVTAAVLRSGHLAHHDAEHSALNLDLSSARVRTAMQLIDGVIAGQPLAALLGYRFERALRDAGLTLAQYILPLRRLAPLRPDPNAPPADDATASETVATRDVVDGVALLERWRDQGAALLGTLQSLPPQADRAAIGAQLDQLADIYDAVADLLVAEAVHQNLLGNNERAGAVLAALDRQERPPQIDFARTPRSGKSYTQRLLLLLDSKTVSAPWRGASNDPRATAEPRLNAWIARLLGNPGRIRLAAAVAGATTQLQLTIDELGLSPLSLALAVQASGNDASSELELRLLRAFEARRTPAQADAAVTLLDAAPKGAPARTIGLAALRALLRRIHTLVTSQRPASAPDLALPPDASDDGYDHAELGARADTLLARYQAALETLDLALAGSDGGALATALDAAAAFGIDQALPDTTIDLPRLDGDRLQAQARAVATTMRAAVARVQSLAASFADQLAHNPQMPAAVRVQHHSERIRVLLGAAFPVLPQFNATNPGELVASNAAHAMLTGADALAPATWLARMALVRPAVDRVAAVRHAAELLGSDVQPADLRVLQLAHTAGERWLALPFAGEPAAAELAIVAIGTATLRFNRPLAGLFCDGWSEIIPAREETTGIALHHDAPGARRHGPLLAVPAAATDPAWSIDLLLDTVAASANSPAARRRSAPARMARHAAAGRVPAGRPSRGRPGREAGRPFRQAKSRARSVRPSSARSSGMSRHSDRQCGAARSGPGGEAGADDVDPPRALPI